MPSHLNRSNLSLGGLLACSLLLVLATAQARGQEQELPAELDLQAMLSGPAVFPAPAPTDGIWRIDPTPGRGLVRIPIIIKKVEKETKLNQASITVRGGRFVCWQLVAHDEDLMLQGKQQQPAQGSQTTPDAIVGEDTKHLPIGVPRFARSLTLTPDGMVAWKMERSFLANGVVVGTPAATPYSLKLNREDIEKLKPAKPAPLAKQANESAAEFARRKLEQERDQRKKETEYLQIIKAVNKLPDEFKGPLPATLWAVYEVRANDTELAIDGPTPLPWSMPMTLLRDLQGLLLVGGNQPATASQPTVAGLGVDRRSIPEMVMAHLAGEKPHVYSGRFIAEAVTRLGYIDDMKENDAKFVMVEKLLSLRDGPTTAALTKRLAVTPSKAAVALATKAIKSGLMDAVAQLSALKGMVDAIQSATTEDGKNPESLLSTVNSFLGDPKGPDPREVVALLVQAGEKNKPLAAAFARGVRFEGLDPDRFKAMVEATIEAAPASEIAAEWLSNLLAGRDVRALLQVLSTFNGARLLAAGEKRSANDKGVVLARRIPLTSAGHGLFSAAQNGNAQVRALAWNCLRFFHVDAAKVVDTDKDRWLRTVVDLAVSQKPMPVAAVEFLSRHPDPGPGDAMIQLVIRGEFIRGQEDISTAAAKALLGSGRRIETMLQAIRDEGDRFTFGVRFYENTVKDAPHALGLLRDKSTTAPAAKWFGESIAGGFIPDAAQWANAFGSEQNLLDYVVSSDDTLAMGAVGALVAAAGGTPADIDKVGQKLRADRTIGVPQLAKDWAVIRRDLFAERLRRTNGSYRVVLRTWVKEAKDAATGVNTPGHWSLNETGKLDVKVEGGNATVGKAAGIIPTDDTLSIQLKPADLKQMPGLETLATPTTVKAIDFKPRLNGGFGAEFKTEAGLMMEVMLVPAK